MSATIMLNANTMREYYRILELHNYNAIMALFSKEAIIVHPIFGTVAAADFFKILLDRAKSHKITIISILQDIDQSDRMATYLNAKFITKDNKEFEEEGVHIFDFQPNGLIRKMVVMIDTFPFREEYAGKKK